MITSYLQGGLGNQMFQIAAAYSLSIDMGVDAAFCSDVHFSPLQGRPVSRYKDNVLSRVSFIDEKTFRQNGNLYKEKKFSYDKIPQVDNMILVGYFQSFKYFENNEQQIRNLFKENKQVKDYIDQTYGHIEFEKSCSLHVRRGDYLKLQHVHPVCSQKYYEKALKEIDTDDVLVFSDDIEWCRENFKYENVNFISDEDYIELYLMAKCKNNIIANSSFSWWAAWLNENENKKVICPTKWFGPKGHKDTDDLYPKNWSKCDE